MEFADDLKCKALRRKFGWQGPAWYWKIIEVMRSREQYRLVYGNFWFETLAREFDIGPEKVREFLDDCIESTHLFNKGKGFLFSERLNRDMAVLQKPVIASATKPVEKPKKKVEPVIDKDFAAMVKLYEEKTGRTLTPSDADLLKDIASTYPKEHFEKAVDEAVKSRARAPMKYIAKVLENWQREKKVAAPQQRTYDDGDRSEGMKEGS